MKYKVGDKVISKTIYDWINVGDEGTITEVYDGLVYVQFDDTILSFIEPFTEIELDTGTSKRYNSGKIQTREIDPAFVLGIGEVLTASREKYDEFNWALPTKLTVPYESLMRHLMAFQKGEDIDPDDGLHHLLKAATNLMFMYYHNQNNPEYSDDRFFKKKNDNEKK